MELSRKQRWTRFAIRLLLPLFVLGGFGSIAGLILPYMERTNTVVSRDSPYGGYIASVVETNAVSSCGSKPVEYGKGVQVVVERHIWLFKTGEFVPMCLASNPRRITLDWDGARTLRISCSGCDAEEYEIVDTNWGDLKFVYDLNKP